MRKQKELFIDSFATYTDYFLTCEKQWDLFNCEKCNIVFIKIFNSVLFDENVEKRNQKIAYLVFWINFIIEKCKRNVEEPLLTTLITIVNKLDLQQLIQFTSRDRNMDFSSELEYETRKVFDETMALTDSQIDILISILNKKDIVFSAPTSYGKTGVVKKSLLLSMEKGFINNFVAILPTKALINEYRKSINQYCKNKSMQVCIVEGPYVKPDSEKTIFLFTQERFLIFNNLYKEYKFDYILFDEAQNLVNSIKPTDNQRELLLAKAISIVDALHIPKIFLMPYIKDPYCSFISKFVNLDSQNLTVIDGLFSPTSSLKYLIKKTDDKFLMFDVTLNRGCYAEPKELDLEISSPSQECGFESIKYDLYKICASKSVNCLQEKNLFFCNKQSISGIAQVFCNNISARSSFSPREIALINYLSEYIGEDFELIDFVKKGVCIHTGDLDSFTKRQIETLFLDSSSGINHIFCTSTLLQGVNMNANNLFFLAKKGKFRNDLLDKKNLLGRVGRLGDCLQGRIFRFYVDTAAIKFETIKDELNSSAEPCEFSKSDFKLPPEEKRNEALKTYLQDKDIRNSFTQNSSASNEDLDCFDYFIGVDAIRQVDEKFSNMDSETIAEIVNALALNNYDCYKKLIEILSDIYEWHSSKDSDLKNRLSRVDFSARLFYNVSIGTSIKHFIKNTMEINEKSGRQPYVVDHKGKLDVWFLTPGELNKYKNEYRMTIRAYMPSDKNILIYSTLRDINDLIEFKLKLYLQDLYYRLKKCTTVKSEDIEAFLTHSLVGNKRKLGLKNIGIVDDFAINKLADKSNLFINDTPNISEIIRYAEAIDASDPIKYAVLDIYQ